MLKTKFVKQPSITALECQVCRQSILKEYVHPGLTTMFKHDNHATSWHEHDVSQLPWHDHGYFMTRLS